MVLDRNESEDRKQEIKAFILMRSGQFLFEKLRNAQQLEAPICIKKISVRKN